MIKIIKEILFFYDNNNLFWRLRLIALSGGIKSLIAKVLYYFIETKNNAYIPLCANFENKPTFPHGIKGILISGGARIGSNVVIFHQVTIGSNNLGDAKNVEHQL